MTEDKRIVKDDDWYEKGGRQIEPERPALPLEVDERPAPPPRPENDA